MPDPSLDRIGNQTSIEHHLNPSVAPPETHSAQSIAVAAIGMPLQNWSVPSFVSVGGQPFASKLKSTESLTTQFPTRRSIHVQTQSQTRSDHPVLPLQTEHTLQIQTHC